MAARLAAVGVLAVSAAVILPRRGALTAETIAGWTPGDPVLAAVALLGLFACKGLSVFFPLAALEAAGGLLFPLWLALPLNIVGAGLAMTLPYLLGRRDRAGLESLLAHHPRLRSLQAVHTGSDFFFLWFVRMTGVFPCDLVSAYFGAVGMAYGAYLSAGLLGMLPHTMAATLLGTALSDLQPRTVLSAVGLNAAVSITALLAWRLRRSR